MRRSLLNAAPLTDAQHAPAPGDDARGPAIALRFPETEFANAHALVLGAASNAPYLATLCERHADWLAEALPLDPGAVFAQLMDDTAAIEHGTRAVVMAGLRQAKARASLLIALCDLGRVWGLDQTTHALSGLAEACLQRTLSFLFAEAHQRGRLPAADAGDGCGYVILAMGKLGAGELNYSSDVDLICLFDHERMGGLAAGDAQQTLVRLTRDLSQMMSERTKDGYVFRVDLRLRPDPGAMPLAISVQTAEAYYEGLGRTWERLAYVKARPVAGDLDLGRDFLEMLRPFVWRRHLDFATLADVRALKTRIHDHFGHGTLGRDLAGFDLKRGRGGIREVEFFAQTQQIIAGGRDPNLRARRTDDALDALVHAGWADEDTTRELMEAYTAFRHAEHRIQMLQDAQTQSVPTDRVDVARLARLCGDADADAMFARLHAHLTTVAGHYDTLFEGLPQGEASALPGRSNIEARLDALGFARPQDGAETIENWSAGRYRATRGERARDTLAAVTPHLLEAMAGNPDPDRSLARFDAALSRLPSGLQFFSMLAARPSLLDLYVEIVGLDAPIADRLARDPDVLATSLTPDFWSTAPTRQAMDEALAAALSAAPPGLEGAMDAVRVVKARLHFQTSVHVMRGVLDPLDGGRVFTHLAEACVTALLDAARRDVERRRGPMDDAVMAVLALGRVGAAEMTAGSDLDLIFIYDGPQEAPAAPPAHLAKWAASLGQTLVTALTAPTREGSLYDVDMRLRPSGKSGPLATTLDAFSAYHGGTAQTWEALALARARVIAGDPAFAQRVGRALAEAQSQPRSRPQTASDVLDMRQRLERDRPARGIWDVKLMPGGLFDIEFAVQFLQTTRERPAFAATREAVAALEADGALSSADAETLRNAHADMAAVAQLCGVMAPGVTDPTEMGVRVRQAVARALDMPDTEAVSERIAHHQTAVRDVFERIVTA